MPKKNSRRSTLSSLDLEIFLSEVTASDDQIKSNRRNTLSSDEILIKEINPDELSIKTRIKVKDNENLNPNVTVSNQDDDKTLLEKKTVIGLSLNDESKAKPVEDRSNEQLIREFCKV